jgi:chemotaxis protein MotB
MKKVLLIAAIIAVTLSSCVSTKKYDAMVSEKDRWVNTSDSLKNIITSKNNLILDQNLKIQNLERELRDLTERYEQVKESASEGALDMLNKLEALQKDIQEREANLAEIKAKLEERERIVQQLRETVQNALLGFEGSELTISVKDGKVYVSMSNKLLFDVGSTNIDKKGQDALIEIAKALQNEPDINILVEGHTDDQQIRAGGRFEDNWDLSVLRATEVVRYLTEDGGLNPKRVIASGRSYYFPIDDADTDEARAKNRRTEIILTPKLEKLFDILD